MNNVLNKQGEIDYDFKNDIFFFKVKERDYSHSVEMNNIVIDFDEENFVTGLQIFDASGFFNLDKRILKQVSGFKMQAKVEKGTIKINLGFEIIVRNKSKSYNPIIFERVSEEIPDSEILCTV